MDAVARDLLAWYDRSRRDLPWRTEVSPYRTWLSEIMLQQTRVETVIPYFERFLERFPTVEALAAAPLDEVLARWSGLGYYSRGRNLHRAAQAIVAAGGFPRSVAGLRALPGIGAYTAGAIASIALGLDEPAVDGNVARVLARLHRHAGGRAEVEALSRAHLPAGRAGDWNQALMDLGARICTPKAPDCPSCPLIGHCAAHARGEVSAFPVRPDKRPVPEVEGVCGALWREGRVLLARRPERGLLGGLYELPGLDPILSSDRGAALRTAWRARLGLDLRAMRPLGSVLHVFTHRRLTLHVYAVEADGEPAPRTLYTALAWILPEEPGDIGLSALARKALALAGR